MTDKTTIDQINKVIEDYFTNNTSATQIPVKELMPAFIAAGIFTKDIKKGHPIRKILRELDKNNELQQIPFVYAERREENTYWYFIPKNAPKPTAIYKQDENVSQQKEIFASRNINDENYVIDLCDKVLEQKAARQKKFTFLLGDMHKNGKSKTELPVDAYYDDFKLAIEYTKQHVESESSSKRYQKETVSGMPRSEQRLRYAARIAKTLPVHGINLISFSNTDFSCDEKNNIIRNEANDLKIVKKALKDYWSEK
ncbi:MAG: hypothetical protein JEZ09_05385 [Salinivirgaceae bacterium]|nr:hypothetical protein [Salinivirgaceae bacterium]